jgi:hypothetical protein
MCSTSSPVLPMPRPKDPPPAAAHAARLVALLSEPASAAPRAMDALAARHRARRRPVKAVRPGAEAPTAARPYAPEGPAGERVFDAFLGELPAPAAARLRAADVASFPDARLAMFLFDAARRHLPRMASAAGDPAAAMALLPLADPSSRAVDPRLYTHAAAAAGGDVGAIARAFEEQRALVAEGRGDRALTRSMLAALAGKLMARAAQLLGPQVLDDLALALDGHGPRRRAPVRRGEAPRDIQQSLPRAERRRAASKTG